ncbi:Putative transport protein YhhT [Rubrobacter xylanophilus DSM 9941]|uniref:AI-2E family transporter n=1 Tax=Rubrobacter xylanophilus TaxID=49319 RepID=UPI001C63CE1A|nr:AI-2E family transporter [Rubrobacter xylanophilus]QYJ16013.1 Putative transport protein YhhT [Rubrobacter xylanophilus DSM 9941]
MDSPEQSPPAADRLVVSAYLQYFLIAAGLVLAVVLVRQIGGVLLTFLMAGVLAYALNPLVRRLEDMRVPRILAVLGVFAVLILVVLAVLLIIIIPAVRQVQQLLQNPQAVVEAATNLLAWAEGLPYVGQRISTVDQDAALAFLQSNLPPAGTMLKAGLGFIGGVFGVFGAILNLVFMLIVAVYMLLDRERIRRGALSLIPATVRGNVLELFSAVEGALVRYLKAQLLLCLLMGVIGWAIVFFTGGEYALLIGVWVGVTELIPVLGPVLGAIPAVVLALVDSPLKALLVASLFLAAQQLEGNVLVPRIMGSSVGVHPLWVMFAMLSATALYGVVGALFAVPIVAMVAASLRYLRGTLVFERWGERLIAPAGAPAGEPAEGQTKERSRT